VNDGTEALKKRVMTGIATACMIGPHNEAFRVVFEQDGVLPDTPHGIEFPGDLQGKVLQWGTGNKGLAAACDPLKDIGHLFCVYF